MKGLSYDGKPIAQMTTEELEAQRRANKTRIAARSGFFGIATVASCFLFPPAAIVTAAIGGLTDYWLVKNNQEIKEELQTR